MSRFSLLLFLSLHSVSRSHGNLEGMSAFYDGMLHPVTQPVALIALVATTFYAGLSKKQLRLFEACLVSMVPLTLILVKFELDPELLKMLILSGAVLSSVGLCLKRCLPESMMYLLLSFVLSLLGMYCNLDEGSAVLNFSTHFGILLTTITVLSYGSIVSRKLVEKGWSLALQIIGSWMLAISLLTLLSASLRGAN